jgi:hypothetical protein
MKPLTANQSAAYFYTKTSFRLMLWLLFTFLSTLCLTTHSSADETPLPGATMSSQPDDALMNFQRAILMSKHRRESTPVSAPQVTAENVASYPLPGAAIVSHVTNNTPVTMGFILNHAVHVPSSAEAHAISVQNGTITFLPGH